MTQPDQAAVNGGAAEQQAENAISLLEGLADKWAVDVDLNSMVAYVTSPMDLRDDAPADVRAAFKKRMVEQIHAIIQQAFIEGGVQTIDHRSATIQAQAERIAELEHDLSEARIESAQRQSRIAQLEANQRTPGAVEHCGMCNNPEEVVHVTENNDMGVVKCWRDCSLPGCPLKPKEPEI